MLHFFNYKAKETPILKEPESEMKDVIYNS